MALTTTWSHWETTIYDHMQLQVRVKLNSQDKIKNTSSVTAELRVLNGQTAVHCYTHSASLGGSFSDSTSAGSYYHGWEMNTETTLISETKTITHETDGKKSITISGSFTCSAGVSASIGAKTVELPDIPRGFTQKPTSEITNITETTLSYSWGTNENCDAIKVYYKPSGSTNSWSGGSVITVNPIAQSGSGVLTGLDPNTKYDIKISCSRALTSVYTDCDIITEQLTETYPYVLGIGTSEISLPVYTTTTIAQTLSIYNPLKRTVDTNDNTKKLIIYVKHKETNTEWSFYGDGITWNNDKNSATISLNTKNLYTVLGPSSTVGNLIYSCKWTEDSATTIPTIGGQFITVPNNCRPLVPDGDSLTYTNNSPQHVILFDGNNQIIIQNQSKISISGPDFYIGGNVLGQTPPDTTYGEIAYWCLQWGDETVPRRLGSNSVSYDAIGDDKDVHIEMWAVDKRGYASNHVSTTISVLPYAQPVATIEAQRTGAYEAGTGQMVLTAKRSSLIAPIMENGEPKVVDGVVQTEDKNRWTANTTYDVITYLVTYKDTNGNTQTYASGRLGNSTADLLSIDGSNGGKIVFSDPNNPLDPNILYNIEFDISDKLFTNMKVTNSIAQAISTFDFNILTPAIGIGATVNKDDIKSGLYAHGVFINNGNGCAESKIESTTINIGDKTVTGGSTAGTVYLDGYVSETADRIESNSVYDETEGAASSTPGHFSSTTRKNKKIQGELFLGGPEYRGKLYLYNGSAYVPIMWYENNTPSQQS